MTVDSFLGEPRLCSCRQRPALVQDAEVREDVLGAAEDSHCDAHVLRVLLRSGARSRRRAA